MSTEANVIELENKPKEEASTKKEEPKAAAVAPTSNEDARLIHVMNHPSNAQFKYPNNYVKTSKYTVINFIFFYLKEQFTRLANVYFLVIACLQQIPNISPTGRWTTLGPLVFILVLTGIKEIIEDVKRHNQDRETNNRKVKVLRDGKWVVVTWEQVLVGDIVRVEKGQYIPADLIAVSTSEPGGLCYIETANLDGETNLKDRQTLSETKELKSESELVTLRDSLLKCEKPNNRLYQFNGTLAFGGKTYPLGPRQTLLRGAQLRNTEWVFGIAIFTGHDTKVMKNLSKAPIKKTNVERRVNTQILYMLVLLLVMSIIGTIGSGVWLTTYSETAWYLGMSDDNLPLTIGLSIITFIILYNNLVPISLYLTVELVKYGQAYLINNDPEMYYEDNDTPAQARTSNLNEELGQVQFIFSDKTGTLTANKMEFKKCTIAGVSYGVGESEMTQMAKANQGGVEVKIESEEEKRKKKKKGFFFEDPQLELDLKNSSSEKSKHAQAFFTALSLCHTVIPEQVKGVTVYQASSPDEAALVSAAKYFGFEFSERTPKEVSAILAGVKKTYKLLNVLEFTNVRKRMSVIMQDPDGKLILMCKGADNVIYERLSPTTPYKSETSKHLEDFAAEGLRTLVVGYVELDEKEYAEWHDKVWHPAATKIVDREKACEDAAELIEKNFILLGATAVEDKLQDEVPDTIATLAKAGIRIWVLTGDKQETAINIGFACKLLTKSMDVIILNEPADKLVGKLKEYLEKYKSLPEGSDSLGLVINGDTLATALNDDVKDLFLDLGLKCKAVICCRVTPLQKALVVKLVKDNKQAITLAIGDGANDVSMIQQAHVGIGISGEEGLQAARSSDYAIAQFRFLKRLLLVHGRLDYRRISKVIMYSFYKNVLLYFTQFWFSFSNGFSGQTLYERWTLAAFNVLFTLVSIVVFGILDQDVSIDDVMKHPQLYSVGLEMYHFNTKTFWAWIGNAIFHSAVIVGFCFGALHAGIIDPSGQEIGLWGVGVVAYSCVLVVITGKLALETQYFTWLNHLFYWGELIVWLGYMLIYSLFFLVPALGLGTDLGFVPYHLLNNASLYLTVILVSVIALYRDLVWKITFRTYWPQSYHIVQELAKTPKSSPKVELPRSETFLGKTGWKGYAFDQPNTVEVAEFDRASEVIKAEKK